MEIPDRVPRDTSARQLEPTWSGIVLYSLFNHTTTVRWSGPSPGPHHVVPYLRPQEMGGSGGFIPVLHDRRIHAGRPSSILVFAFGILSISSTQPEATVRRRTHRISQHRMDENVLGLPCFGVEYPIKIASRTSQNSMLGCKCGRLSWQD